MNPSINAYYHEILDVYSKEKPTFLIPFFKSKAVQRISDISQACGVEYSKLSDRLKCSRLDHSLGVALIVWNFTKDPKQTLAGFFHDISHTLFSHAGDRLLGDVEKQESSEIYADKILRNDPIITNELEKLGIDIKEVDDYELYPIADNPGPRMAADRLEYTLATGIQVRRRTIDQIKRIYDDIIILKNEDGIEELGFQNFELAEKLGLLSIEVDEICISGYESVIGMGFLSEILKYIIKNKYINNFDMYTMTEKELIKLIKDSNDDKLIEMWNFFKNLSSYKIDRYEPKTNKFCISSKCKRRHIDPLIKTEKGNIRLSKISDKFVQARDYNLNRKEEWIVLDYVL